MHPKRRQNVQRLHDFAKQGQWDDIYRVSVLHEFGPEYRMGFQLAFLAPFCVPALADVLVEAGGVTNKPSRRAYHTGLIMYEIIAGGLESAAAQRLITHMNAVHRRFQAITDEQMSYVLRAFVVVPGRFVEQAGWRKLTDIEKVAAVQFYAKLGEKMGIADISLDWDHAAEKFDQYSTRIEPTESTRTLGSAFMTVLTKRVPSPVRPYAPTLFSVLLNNPAASEALGLPKVHPALQKTAHALMASRRILALTPPKSEPYFVPGGAVRIYPEGYTVNDLVKP